MGSLLKIPHKLAIGFSLLELLLVLAIMSLLVSLAVPQWQFQQHRVHRQLAWLQLQHIALVQATYHQQQGTYAQTITDLGLPAADHAYSYSLTNFTDDFQIMAQVLVPGPQQGDSQCWQLVFHSSAGVYAVSQSGHQHNKCH
ncbi:MAG: prepilin-type N-terminal cleavage/methylation domain-containing protein [Gammaproteobacteria bacterium]|jgi:type IV pilus assembly protein PilE|nr:prepilin-type N-terminal cleavage/methylation domain-containing protein [Gammaproteobacteria bacterium]